MKLLYELDSNLEYDVREELNEATGKTGKKYTIKGVFSTIGEKNRNGRIYPSNIWEKEIASYQGNFSNGSHTTLMEYQHPARTSVDPMEAVAKINKLSIVGNKVMGEAVLLDNPKANQLKTLIDNGIKISVSSRGIGSVKNGIVEDFRLVTYDIVDTPSDFNATMNGMVESHQMNEGIIEDMNFKIDESGNISKVCKEDGVCHMFESHEVEDAILSKFSDVLDSLSENKAHKISNDDFNQPKFQKWMKDSMGDMMTNGNTIILKNKAGKEVLQYNKKQERMIITQPKLQMKQLMMYGLGNSMNERMKVNIDAIIDELKNLDDKQLAKVFAFVLQLQD